MAGKQLAVFDEGSEQLPSDWHDEIVCHTIRRNPDGSVTAIALINLYGDGKVWTAERTIRLECKG